MRSMRYPEITAIVVLVLAGACSTPAPRVYSTIGVENEEQGSVRLGRSETKGVNRAVELRLRNLDPPRRLAPDANVYVVWLEPLEQAKPPGELPEPQNLGALKIDEYSNARFETVTSTRRFRLLITAERGPSGRRPTGSPIYWTDPLGEEPN